jgi:hypothetical protein
MLAGGYVSSYEFGYQFGNQRFVAWYYTVTAAGDLEGGRSGGLYANADITGSSWFNFMTTNYRLVQPDRERPQRREGQAQHQPNNR